MRPVDLSMTSSRRIGFRLLGLPEGSPAMSRELADVLRLDGEYTAVAPWMDVGAGVVYGDQPVGLTGGGTIQLPLRESHCGDQELMWMTDFAFLCATAESRIAGVIYENVTVIYVPPGGALPENKIAGLRFEYAAARYLE